MTSEECASRETLRILARRIQHSSYTPQILVKSAAAFLMDVELVVAEFFSGIGGLHFALQRSGLRHRVVQAYDVDEPANATYRHNLDAPVSAVDLCGVTADQLASLRANTWLLSPPCQPYSRQARAKLVPIPGPLTPQPASAHRWPTTAHCACRACNSANSTSVPRLCFT